MKAEGRKVESGKRKAETNAVKERPILFNGEMVRAVLDGRKTQTRRVVKPQPKRVTGAGGADCTKRYTWDGGGVHFAEFPSWVSEYALSCCPYGKPGDRLWVRETTCIAPKRFATPDETCVKDYDGDYRYVSFKADGHSEEAMRDYKLKWTPSIHVPRWASRIQLEITDIRVERVQDITEMDARDEGIQYADGGWGKPVSPGEYGRSSAKWAFQDLWNSINAKRGYGWDVNPWVWVVEFKVLEVKS